MIRSIEHRLLYSDERFHAAFPSIARLKNGQLLLAFRRARDCAWLIDSEKRRELDFTSRVDHLDSRSHIALINLDAKGRPLSDEVDCLPMDPEAGDQDPSLLVLENGQVLLSSFSYYPLPSDIAPHVKGARTLGNSEDHFLFWGSHVSIRKADSRTWRYHHLFLPPSPAPDRAISPNGAKCIAGASRGQATEWNGKLWVPVYGESRHAAAVYQSSNGKDWHFHAIIACDSTGTIRFQEPALCADPNAGLVCFMRTAGADKDYLATTVSRDGAHWSEPKLHNLTGHPHHPLRLRDGRVLLTYGFRSQPSGVRAVILDQPTADPDLAREWIIRDDGLGSDLGYPWSTQLADNTILTVYYMTSQRGLREIWGSWIKLE